MKSVLISGLIFLSLNSPAQDCPEKIRWKKLKAESEVQMILNNCLPSQSEKSVIFTFLSKHKAIFSEVQDGIIYASAVTRSRSLWIEKQWLMEFVLDKDDRLVEIRVKIGLTGPRCVQIPPIKKPVVSDRFFYYISYLLIFVCTGTVIEIHSYIK